MILLPKRKFHYIKVKVSCYIFRSMAYFFRNETRKEGIFLTLFMDLVLQTLGLAEIAEIADTETQTAITQLL